MEHSTLVWIVICQYLHESVRVIVLKKKGFSYLPDRVSLAGRKGLLKSFTLLDKNTDRENDRGNILPAMIPLLLRSNRSRELE